jgi:hypothetical protein
VHLWSSESPPSFENIPLRVIVAANIVVFVQTPLGQLLMSAVRDSDDNINSDRLGTHSVFAARCLHRN